MGRFFLSTLSLALILSFAGCNNGGTPLTPNADSTPSPPPSHQLWGFWEVLIDGSTGAVELSPLRSAMFNSNVVKFLQPPWAPIHLLTIQINPGTNFLTGLIDINVTIRHPFPGANKFRGFDVRGIVMGSGTEVSQIESSAIRAGSSELQLLNADGWTRWWNPSEFTTFGTILGYTQGAKATPGFLANTTVNPYKYFCDALDADSPLSNIPLDSRGSFSTQPGINTRRYILQFPLDPSGKPIYRFNYAVDASWALPDESFAPNYPPEAFPPEANTQEAWQISIDDSGSTAWYVNDQAKGGFVKLTVEVFDWQGWLGPSTVADEVASIWVESPILSSPVDILPISSPNPGTDASSVWSVELADLNLTSAGEFDVWVAVEASHPENYSPQIQGDPNAFAWPDVPLRAWMRGKVHVKDNAGTAPQVLQVIPSQGEVSTVLDDVQIVGDHFLNGATVEFKHDLTTLTVSDITWVTENLITCDVDCTAPLGFYDVTVTNPDLQHGTLKDGFEIIESFGCSGSAHDWGGEYQLTGISYADTNRFDMAVLHKGTHAGKALFQINSHTWGLIDPNGDAGQPVEFFFNTPSCYCVEIETCETTGRIAIISLFTDEAVWIYDSEGAKLGDFIDPYLPNNGNFTAIDFDKHGDMWAVTRTGNINDQSTWVWELRHYKMLPESPFYEPIPEDTVDITNLAMISPHNGDGIGDLGISFYLDRLFIIVANTVDGGSNKITSWDISVSPPVKIGEIMNPYPPLTRHHIFSQGALSRMNIDVDHRFEDKYEQCRIYAYATIWTNPGLDCYVIRLDGDLNILDTGSVFKTGWPPEWDDIPQCAIINDADPTSEGNLFGCGWNGTDFDKWPVPSDW